MKTNTRHWAGITAGILSLAGYASAASVGNEKYVYDASGNIIEKRIDGKVTKMSYDKANRIVGKDKEVYSYDAAGRPVAERYADGQTSRNLSYGYGDKVLETQTQNSKACFYYNAEGQLVGKNVRGNVSTYTWDGNVLAAEGAEAFANEAHISGGVPALKSGKDIVISDYLGSTLVSGDENFISTAYGEGLEQGRFTGKVFVKELQSYAFGYRLYSAETNCWAYSDPSGFPDGANSIAYVGGDPLSKVDPLGLWTIEGPLPGASGTYGEHDPQVPTNSPWIPQIKKTWAKEWSATGWFKTQQSVTGPYNSAWTGTLSAGTSTTTTFSVGFQNEPVTLTASVASSVNTGSSQSKNFDAVDHTAFEMRGAIKTGDITKYEVSWIWDTDIWYPDTTYGSGGVLKTVIDTNVKVPTMVGYEVWKDVEN